LKKILLTAALATLSISSFAQFVNTGWEPPTYVLGSGTQQNWVFGGGWSIVSSTTTTPNGFGQQMVRIAPTSGTSATNLSNSIGGISGAVYGTGAWTISTKIQVATSANSNREFGLSVIGTLDLSSKAQITIQQNGTVRGTVGDTVIRSNVGTLTAPFLDQWIDMSITIDMATRTKTAVVNGQTFNLGTYGTISSSQNISEIRFFSTGSASTDLGNAYFDDFAINPVPEPATLTALGLGAVAMLRRRNKKA
jgi:hypothetical protein